MGLFESVTPRRGGRPETLLEDLARDPSDVGRRARAAFDLWLEEIPSDDRGVMQSRLQADDLAFQSTFFELYLHALFRRLGYELDIHPRVSMQHERAPDFLIRRGREPRFYLEGTVIGEDEGTVASRRRLRIAVEALRKVQSAGFDLGLERAEFREEYFARRRVIASVQQWLDDLDPFTVEMEAMSAGIRGRVAEFKTADLLLRLWALPRPALARGIKIPVQVTLVRSGVGLVACADGVRRALSRKAYHYGDLLLPCVIAVNALDDACDIEEIQSAAFGSLATHVGGGEAAELTTLTVRLKDGALSDPERSPSRRVSAVMAEVALTPWTMFSERVTPVLLLNPEARYTLSPQELPLLQIEDGRGDGSLAGRGYIPARRILGLDKTIVV